MPRKVSISSHWIAYAIAIAGAGLLVYWCRLARPLWVDEEMIALNARWRSFADLGGPLWLDQSAPLGWLALERAVLVAFGTGERAARALPVVCGIGTLAVAAWIGRRWMTALGAAILVGLCSIGPWIVFFTLELKQVLFGCLLGAPRTRAGRVGAGGRRPRSCGAANRRVVDGCRRGFMAVERRHVRRTRMCRHPRVPDVAAVRRS